MTQQQDANENISPAADDSADVSPAVPATDESFDFVDLEAETPQRFSRWFWLQWIILLLIGFVLLDILIGGFDTMHRYGWSETGINWALLINKWEKIFALALFAMLPAAVFMVLAFEDILNEPLKRMTAWWSKPARSRLLVPMFTLLAGVLILASILFIFHRQPITDDENVYLFQSRIFASGQLTLPSLPMTEPLQDRIFEDNVFMVNNGKIFGQYPFGHSFLLIPTYLLGFPRLMMILLAMFSVLGMYLLASRLYGKSLGLAAAALLAISPMFLATSSTLLSHPTALCFLIWFFYFAHRTWKESGWLNALLAGLFFFLAFQARSTTALLAGGPIGLALAFALLRDWRNTWPKIAALTLMIALTLGVTFTLNYLVNGAIMKTNYHAAWGEGQTPFQHPFGFGKGAWHMVHTPSIGLTSIFNNFIRLNGWLLGWPISLLFVFVWLLRRDKKSIEWIGFITVVLTFAAYFFYFWPGISDTGPVLYYELSAVLILLSISGMVAATRLLMRWMPRDDARRRVALFVVFSCLVAFFTFHQVQARTLHRTASNVAELAETLDRYDVPENAVVFTNYYLKGTKSYNHQDSWVVGRPPSSRLLNDERLFYVNYGAARNRQFMEKYHPDLPAFVVVWSPAGVPEVATLAEYQIDFLPDNFPDSR